MSEQYPTLREAVIPEGDNTPNTDSGCMDHPVRFFSGPSDKDEWVVLSSYMGDDGYTIFIDIQRK